VSTQSLRRRADFSRVRGRGRRFQTSRLAVYSIEKREGPIRVGIVVGRIVGCAVERNLVRRRLREAFRALAGPVPRDLVIVARPESLRATYAELAADLAAAL
jgi:ribonuclease P protein component